MLKEYRDNENFMNGSVNFIGEGNTLFTDVQAI